MNRLDAMFYALCSTPPDRPLPRYIDLRVSAYVGAMKQANIPYEEVSFDSLWAARCQIGMLAGDMLAEVEFGAPIPCGKKGTPKAADADDFCDARYRPSKALVTEAARRFDLLYLGAHGHVRPTPYTGTTQAAARPVTAHCPACARAREGRPVEAQS